MKLFQKCPSNMLPVSDALGMCCW